MKTTTRATPHTDDDCEELARRLAAALEADRRERRRRLWRKLWWVLMLLGALSSVLGGLAALVDVVW